MAESITITDNRTGESLEIPIDNGGVDAAEWRKLLPGIWFHDPGLATTSGADSAITELDGENGILRYRGYPIEQLAQQSTFLEVSYLLIHGELPTQAQLDAWVHEITHHTFLHEKFRTRMYDAYHYDAHPMGLLTSSVAGLSTFYPEAKDIDDPDVRMEQIVRLIAKMPTMAASAHRHAMGLPYVFPDNALDYPSNFLNMMFQVGNPYEIHPALHKAMEILLILHADHEQNCSTTAARVVGSAHADPYSSVAAAAGEGRLMGFGHRVYKNYDPRAAIIKDAAYDVFEVTGKNPRLDIALKLEEVALSDSYFVDRKLYPNVDFYSGLIYESMGFPVEMFTVLFAIGRTPGWLAHWNEMLEQNSRIARPRQRYTGAGVRDYVAIDAR